MLLTSFKDGVKAKYETVSGLHSHRSMLVILCEIVGPARQIYGEHLQVLTLVRDSSGVFLLSREDGSELLGYPPQNVIAIVYESSPGVELANELSKWTRQNRIDAPILRHDNALAVALSDFGRQLFASSRLHSDLLLRLAELRRIHEELQNSYDGLRSIVIERGDVIPRLAFMNPPDPDGEVIQVSAAEILQTIPLNLPSLCAISLSIAKEIPAFSDGQLTIEVFSPDDDSISFKWTSPVTQLRPGLMTLVFDRPGRYLRHSAAIRILYRAVTGDGPFFNLGKEQLRREKAAAIGGVHISRALAMRLWSSPPGAPVIVTSQMGRTLRIDRRPVTCIELAIDEDLTFSDPYSCKDRLTFDPIKLIVESHRLMVHPTMLGPTVARLHGVCPIGTREVYAEVQTMSDEAGPVEYALAIVNSPAALPSVEELANFADRIDWLELPPKVDGLLTLKLEIPTTRLSDILLMTRLPEFGKPDYCWANFTRISFVGDFG